MALSFSATRAERARLSIGSVVCVKELTEYGDNVFASNFGRQQTRTSPFHDIPIFLLANKHIESLVHAVILADLDMKKNIFRRHHQLASQTDDPPKSGQHDNFPRKNDAGAE